MPTAVQFFRWRIGADHYHQRVPVSSAGAKHSGLVLHHQLPPNCHRGELGAHCSFVYYTSTRQPKVSCNFNVWVRWVVTTCCIKIEVYLERLWKTSCHLAQCLVYCTSSHNAWVWLLTELVLSLLPTWPLYLCHPSTRSTRIPFGSYKCCLCIDHHTHTLTRLAHTMNLSVYVGVTNKCGCQLNIILLIWLVKLLALLPL